MNARRFLLSAAFIVLCFGCAVSTEPPKAEAPPAGRPKPWSELILGKWRQVEHDFAAEIVQEYTTDGKRITRISSKEGGNREPVVQYRLAGAILTFEPSNAHRVSPRQGIRLPRTRLSRPTSPRLS